MPMLLHQPPSHVILHETDQPLDFTMSKFKTKSGDDGRLATQTVQSGGATTHDVAPEQRGVLQQKQQGVRAREQSVE
jgi:hypothetical protein